MIEYIIIIVLSVVAIVFFILYVAERKNSFRMSKKYKELDAEYTQLLASNMKQEEELLRIKKDYNKQHEMTSEIKKLHEKTRLLKHDMKNHIMVITSFLNENKIDSAKQYTSTILDDLNKMYTYIHVGNALLNYIINDKFEKASKSGVAVKAEIRNLSFDNMESVDFSALLNNLLDNAIEAAAHSQMKKLEVNILEKKGWNCIYVANTIDSSVLEKNSEFVTTKQEEGHGFGMKQIFRIVEKYQALIDIYEEEGCFCVNIMIPN